ncbi:flagellar assembly protein FliH [Bacillus sp. FJAT-45350]|uniref:flagellar assembly protein FliH n=1 Tax=Bacillus sp. FJAT-45350 TaxID=2011014 RepID=UPI0015CEE2E6|nr:flagellar assembly protein FliH [Bacillus sp. FJAT-45350]
MSRLIKSPFAQANEIEAKTIGIKKLFDDFEPLDLTGKISLDAIEPEESKIEEKSNKLAEEIISEANLQAERVLQQAKQELIDARKQIENERQVAQDEIFQLKEQAKEQGFQEGYQIGQQEGQHSFDNLIAEAQNVVESAKDDYFKTIKNAEPIIIQLAMKVSKKIIGQSLSQDEDCWKHVLEQVINEVREHEHIKIYVPPKWYELTLKKKEELESMLPHRQELYIYPDNKLYSDGCIIETPFGQIDATIDSQLNEIRIQLLEKLKEERNERQ